MKSYLERLPNTDFPLIPPLPETWLKNIKQANDRLNIVLETLSASQNLVPILLGIILGYICLAIIYALLSAINQIFLLGNCLEAIGLGYSIWFGFRYLLFAANRQELKIKIKNYQADLFGS